MDLFDLNKNDRFIWQGETYILLNIDEDNNATVQKESSKERLNFNPYARIKKVEE